MKETGDSNAPFFGLQEGLNPEPHVPAYYGSNRVPHPCNEPAKKVDHAKVMRQILQAK